FVTGTIPIGGVPANAEIIAAFLYWETISTDVAQHKGVTFRGSPVTVAVAKSKPLVDASASCWVGGRANANYSITMFRADVMHLLPEQKDVHGTPTGRRLVNDADLAKAGLSLNTVKLPDKGNANIVPQSA